MLENASSITLEEWRRRVNAHCQTISRYYCPTSAARVYEYTCRASEFLELPTYPVYYTTKDRGRLVDWNDPEATAITIRDFAANPDFVKKLPHAWRHKGGGPIQSAELIVHYCTSCDRRVVIDGVHRIVSIAVQNTPDTELRVTELAGTAWPQDMPDMSVVCNCR